jgi:hypothetical protein
MQTRTHVTSDLLASLSSSRKIESLARKPLEPAVKIEHWNSTKRQERIIIGVRRSVGI